MQWYAVYDTESGRLVSIGTELANPLPPQRNFITCDERPDPKQWDSTLRAFWKADIFTSESNEDEEGEDEDADEQVAIAAEAGEETL